MHTEIYIERTKYRFQDRRGKAREGKFRRGEVRRGKFRREKVRRGKFWREKVRRGKILVPLWNMKVEEGK